MTRTTKIKVAVSAVIIAVVALISILFYGAIQEKDAAQSQSGAQTFAVAPIIYSSLGVNKEDSAKPTLDLYFDYTCSHCVEVESVIDDDLYAQVEAGDFNVAFHPVTTVGAAFAEPATAASLLVAQQDPDHWLDFHKALVAYVKSQIDASNGQVIQDSSRSVAEVADIATEFGVSADTIKQFANVSATSYLKSSTDAWVNADISGRTNGVGTPEFVVSGKHIDIPAGTSADVMKVLDSALGLD